MQITLPCETYARLVNIPLSNPPDHFESYPYVKSLYFERKEGYLFVVCTNIKVGVVEFIGTNVGPDESGAIIADKTLKMICENEIQFAGSLDIMLMQPLALATIKSTGGFQFPGNPYVALPQDNFLT